MGAVIDDNVILQRIYLFCVSKSSQQTKTCSKQVVWDSDWWHSPVSRPEQAWQAGDAKESRTWKQQEHLRDREAFYITGSAWVAAKVSCSIYLIVKIMKRRCPIGICVSESACREDYCPYLVTVWAQITVKVWPSDKKYSRSRRMSSQPINIKEGLDIT